MTPRKAAQPSTSEHASARGRVRCAAQRLRVGVDLRKQRQASFTLVAQCLAPYQIVGLDCRGPFVNGDDAGIAAVLRGAGFLYIAHAAENLQGIVGDPLRLFREPAFEHRNEQFRPALCQLRGRIASFATVGHILMHRHVDCERAHGVDPALHRHKHAAHVGMTDDGRAGAALLARRRTLHPFLCVRERVLVGP